MPTISDLRLQAATIKNATQVGENTATRVGTTFETIADLLEQQGVGQGVPSVDLSQLNTLRTPADQTTANPTIYNVTTLHNLSSTTIKVGTLFIFSDGGRAVVTQILLSNYQVDGGGNISSPNASQITMYYRMYNIVQETWSAWTLYAGGGGGGTIDPYPVSGSDNAVASNGVFERLQQAAPEVNINDIDDLDDFVDMQTGVASTYTIKAYHNLSSTWLRVGVLMVFANQAQNTLTQICISNCMVDGGGNLIPNYTTNVMNVFYRFKQFSGNPPEGMTIGVWTTWAKFGDSGYQPDNEDIDLNANDQLQFANKAYDASAFSGLGRVYLRKNIVQLNLTDKYFDGFVNDVLVQDVGTSSTPDAILFDTTRKMFVARVGLLYYVDWSSDEDYNPITRDVNWNYNGNFYRWNGEELVQWDKTINQLTQAMVNTANTIYHIQYDYDLNGQTITIPDGCVLEFEGGSLSNGKIVAATGGTYNINYYSGKGIACELGNDFNEVRASWLGISGYSDPNYNRNRLQMVCNLLSKDIQSHITRGMPKFVVDVPKIDVSGSVEVSSSLNITSSFDSALISSAYPVIEFIGDENENGDYNCGFLFVARYCSSNDVSNLCIKSKNHCFDFENETLAIARSIYYSAFHNLILYSANGDCIHKKTVGSSVFSCRFSNIDGNCPNGHVINGAFGLNNLFDNIRVIGEDAANPKNGTLCALSVFNNCSGVFQNINIGDKNVTGFITFDNNMSGNDKRIIIKNSNIEQITGGLITSPSDVVNNSYKIILENVSILFYNTDERGFPNGVDFDIILVHDIRELEVINVIIPNMASGYYFVKTWGCASTPKLSGNIEFTIRANSSSYSSYYALYYYYPATQASLSYNGENRLIRYLKDLKISDNLILNGVDVGRDLFITGTIRTWKLVNGGNPTIGTTDFMNLEITQNVETRNLVLGSSPTKTKVKITNTSGSYYIGLNINGYIRRLEAGESMFVAIMGGTIVALAEDGTTGVGTTTGRPSAAYIGFKYFDTTLAKPIWSDGTQWVDATGTAVQ